ncbi:dihydroorotate dehydrogenase B (NAD(+)), electron transfer subunit [Clostridium pasteurianum DSM 525 = ATCC 6013]|uniref:Dihydroorotate dehydrogenase B (NAD(+)), electron transfer subunit n=1 Tax=Clostridium pasteurianum DSM 525 = ATCC 6013 TaxID=1262449 RepID=A0A0H3J5M6_CLOPA|nr:dihydroorotate dehydrogenase electron transfer subunit [Clostridium pasteurianum]AJA48754.1 dihydroorotate dehydrogenase B (NAD(+)), electron transfer subunit [Clostridium pasteurianum DSM 525 = ATCC 6013]AJA52742.1 dihydroorotate dehydrogenase B (NAD(+)), electron transfer subunit [Clostridium pasteurianum DSM 525 = ATCC 6013]AOZ75977.1 diguanylate cyclase [Clostridium pasteurianum DSM 525 = ATCC 6013]AOZ79773.1 diguanylate cyclase [Clostridium pasteurianum]ELP60053.1 dihydroorotate dehydr
MSEKYMVKNVFSNEKIEEDIYEITIDGKFEGNPGQFYLLRAWDEEPVLSRPISIYDKDEEKIKFLYRVCGRGTEILTKLKKGDEIKLTGPLGNGFPLEKLKGKVALVAGGIGIAPMLYLAKKLKNSSLDLYAGFRSGSKTVDDVGKNVNKLYLSTENGEVGHKGYVTDLLNVENYDVVVCCGPEIMMSKIIKMCDEKKVPLYVSMENRMACGIGACLVCTCKTKDGRKRSCKEGPVFLGEELVIND